MIVTGGSFALNARTFQLSVLALGLSACAQILGVDEEAKLKETSASSTTGSGGDGSSSASSTASGTGGATCGDCTPANDCMQGECAGGMCTSMAKPPGASCSTGVCTLDSTCVECLGVTDCNATAPLCTADHKCVPATCSDLSKDGDETGTDCGGSCSPCPNGLGCMARADCVSGHCAGTVCAPCANDGDCESDFYCDTGSGACVVKHFNGASCLTANECQSERCVGVTGGTKICCDSDCAAGCDSCLAAETNAPDGTCAHVRVALDPKDACAPAPCADGSCNGAGGCSVFAQGTPCSAAACIGAAYDPPDQCDAGGQCIQTSAAACANNTVCMGTSCPGGCVLQTDCVSGFYCAAPTCMQKKTKNKPCQNNYECASGTCGGNHKCT
jgi:hypothetical protein